MLEEWTWEKLCDEFRGGDMQTKLLKLVNQEGVLDLVIFEKRMMDSSSYGRRSIGAVGPGCTFKDRESCIEKWLNDAPSTRQYPVAYVSRFRAPEKNR